jgi:acyl-coenzyme A thioesterase PaaI-like protein
MTKPIENQHNNCIACGKDNPFSLGLSFSLLENQAVQASFIGTSNLQGYEGILHGGITSTLLDSAMVHCLFFHNIKAMTADLRVRFLHSIPCNAKMIITAWITCAVSSLYELQAEVKVDGKIMAKAKGKFMAQEGLRI